MRISDWSSDVCSSDLREPDRMKILVLSSFAFSLVNFRGRPLSAMAAAGHDVIACAPDTEQAVEAVRGRTGLGHRRKPMGRTGAKPFEELGGEQRGERVCRNV